MAKRGAASGVRTRSVLLRRLGPASASALAVALVLLGGNAALADCVPAAADNVTATCSGTTTNQGAGAPGTSASTQGYGSGTQTNVTVTIAGGATVTGSDNGINVGSGTFTNNPGATVSGANWGIRAATGAADVTNAGTIRGTNADGVFGQTDAIVTNNSGGVIQGQGFDGVHAERNAMVTNAAGATIGGALTGVYGLNNAIVTNSGSITGTAAVGIHAQTGSATVTNNAGGTITGAWGVFAGGAVNVTNSGRIDGTTTGSGIFSTGTATVINNAGATISGGEGITSATGVNITNSGTITGTDVAGATIHTLGPATVTNNSAATIIGASGVFAAGPVTVTNSGTIRATSAVGIRSTGGSVTLINNAGGVVAGATLGHAVTANGSGSSIFNAGTITGGDLGAILFSGAGNVLTLAPSSVISGVVTGAGSDTLQLGGSGAASFDMSQVGPAAQYQGFTTFNKIDGSTWTLTGTPAQATDWTISGGVLSVNGAMPSSTVAVNNGGTLGGNGSVGNTTVNAGGTLAPGNSIGLITINGTLVMGAGAIYKVETSGASADKTVVTGNAGLNGTVSVNPLTRLTVRTTYTILSAASLSGTFGSAGFSAANSLARNPVLTYSGGNVFLTLDPGLLSPNLPGVTTANQRSVAAGIDSGLQGGSPFTGFDALFALSSAALPAALDQLSGEVHASMVSVLADESLYARSAILGRLRQASYGDSTMGAMAALRIGGPQAFAGADEINTALAYAKSPVVTKSPIVTKAPPMAPVPTSDIVFWAQGFGAWGKFNSDGNAASVSRNLAGFISGADMRVGGNGRVGFAAGYTGSQNNTDGRGSANVDTGHVAAYGGWSFGALNLRGGADYAFHTISTDRSIVFPGFFDRAFANYDGSTAQIFGEAGYGFALANIALEPFAGGAWVRVHTDAGAERALLAGLNFASADFEVGYSTLGIRAASVVPLANGMVLIPRASAAWQHAFGSVAATDVLAFQAAPASPFTISGVPIARDAALVEAGLDLALNAHATVGVSYTGQLANNVADHAAKGKFSWKF